MYQKKWLFIFISFLSISGLFAQEKDRILEKKIEHLLAGFHGEVGVYIKNLKTGKVVSINGDTVFPTASMVKVPILIGVFNKIENKELDFHQKIIYRDSLLYEGEDILGSFKDSQSVELAKVIMLMLTTSDNTASLWLQQLAGGGKKINQILDSSGFIDTRVNSRTPGREENRSLHGWGQTTPREMGKLFEYLYEGRFFNKAASEKMLRLLGRNAWDEEALSQIPPYIFTASKNGAVNQSRSETILVMAPTGPYIFSIITKQQSDERWDPDNEGWVLARKLSSLLWNYYVPGNKWRPALDAFGKPL